MNSRGNNLLMEEKERTRVNKALPRLEQVKFPSLFLCRVELMIFTSGASRTHRSLGGQPGQGVPGRRDQLHRLHPGPGQLLDGLDFICSMIQLYPSERAALPGPGGGKEGQGEGQEGDAAPRDQVWCQAVHPSQVERFVFQHLQVLISHFSKPAGHNNTKTPRKMPPTPKNLVRSNSSRLAQKVVSGNFCHSHFDLT